VERGTGGRASFQRLIAGQHTVEACDDRWPWEVRRWQLLVVLPTAAQASVQRDELFGGAQLRGRVLLFDVVLRAFGVHQVQEVGEAANVALICQRNCTLTCGQWRRGGG
jgi:hypothetical protein